MIWAGPAHRQSSPPHSPTIAAVPGANILELGDWGMRSSRREELHLVAAWRHFLADPGSFFHHLLAD
jgi:predicted ATPase